MATLFIRFISGEVDKFECTAMNEALEYMDHIHLTPLRLYKIKNCVINLANVEKVWVREY